MGRGSRARGDVAQQEDWRGWRRHMPFCALNRWVSGVVARCTPLVPHFVSTPASVPVLHNITDFPAVQAGS